MAADVKERGAGEVVAAIVTAVQGVVLPGSDPAAPAFGQVGLFDSENLVEAFRYLLLSEQRVAVVVPLTEEYEPVSEGLLLVCRRTLPVAILCSDAVLGDRKAALWGTDAAGIATPGAYKLAELVKAAVVGTVLGGEHKVVALPVNLQVMSVRDTEKDLPGRMVAMLEVKCRGGRIEAAVGRGQAF